MAIYNVTLRTPEGEITIQCPDDVYILDAAADYFGMAILDEVVVNGGTPTSGKSFSTNGNSAAISPNSSSERGGQSNDDDPCEHDILELVINANQNVFNRLSSKYQNMAEQAEKNFNKNNKRSYQEAQSIFKKINNDPNYKLKKSDISSIRNALALDELKDIQKNANQISKAIGKVVIISDIYAFGDAIERSINQNDWRPLFDQTVSFGAGKMISIAFAFTVPVSLPAIISISVISALSSYFFRSEKIQE